MFNEPTINIPTVESAASAAIGAGVAYAMEQDPILGAVGGAVLPKLAISTLNLLQTIGKKIGLIRHDRAPIKNAPLFGHETEVGVISSAGLIAGAAGTSMLNVSAKDIKDLIQPHADTAKIANDAVRGLGIALSMHTSKEPVVKAVNVGAHAVSAGKNVVVTAFKGLSSKGDAAKTTNAAANNKDATKAANGAGTDTPSSDSANNDTHTKRGNGSPYNLRTLKPKAS